MTWKDKITMKIDSISLHTVNSYLQITKADRLLKVWSDVGYTC